MTATAPAVLNASGRACTGSSTASWPEADLTRRVVGALEFAITAVAEFGETGYRDAQRPALGFAPEKIVGEAALLAYVAAGASVGIRARIAELVDVLAPLVRSPRAAADMSLHRDRVFQRAIPHVLLTRLGLPDEEWDGFAWEHCKNVLAHAVDEAETVLAERDWILRLWSRQQAARPVLGLGTAWELPIDHARSSREDAYGLSHLLFYATEFGQGKARPLRRREELLADVEAQLIYYLAHDDFDLVGELLMAWPQLHAKWSPAAAFAFRVLTSAEDEVGVLPCGNFNPARLLELDGRDGARYARAISYHTALVMGLLCATAMLPGAVPPLAIEAQGAPFEWERFLELIPDRQTHWISVFQSCTVSEKRALAPMLGDIAVSAALRRRDYRGVWAAILEAERQGMTRSALQRSAAHLVQSLDQSARLSGARVPSGLIRP